MPLYPLLQRVVAVAVAVAVAVVAVAVTVGFRPWIRPSTLRLTEVVWPVVASPLVGSFAAVVME
jgi:hypothetical protein